MNLVEINLHGNCFNGLKPKYRLKVKNASEALHAINILSGRKFYKQLLENDQKNIKYEVLINKNPCLFPEKPDINKPETILNSELFADYETLKTIDIVPVIEGAEALINPFSDIHMVVSGIILVAVGVVLIATGAGAIFGVPLIFAGLGLLAAGIINLLTSPPKLEDFKGATRRGSYMFDGPQNTVGEGGPVPLIYGQLIVGSQVVVQTYGITNENAGDLITT